MNLLDTVSTPNDLCAHALDYLAVYRNGVITRYAKNDAAPFLTADATTYTLAGVLAIAISANGQYIVAQTATRTYKMTAGVTTDFEILGTFDVSDAGTIVVVNPSISTIHVVTTTTRNINATVSAKDRVACGTATFVVYDSLRYIRLAYEGTVASATQFAKSVLFVKHIESTYFAWFHKDGSVTYKSKNFPNRPTQSLRSLGRWVTGMDGQFDWAFQLLAPQSAALKIRVNSTPLPTPKLELIVEKPITSAQFQYPEGLVNAADRLYLPTIPLRSLGQDLSETVGTAIAGLTMCAPYSAGGDNVVMKAINSPTYISKDRGVTWAAMSSVVNYNGGVTVQSKGRVYVFDDKVALPIPWRNYEPTLTTFSSVASDTEVIGNMLTQFGCFNANCFASSTSTTANGANIYISWAFPIFTAYNISTTTSTNIRYVGCNVFEVIDGAGTRLFYIPPTQGAPVLLKTLPAQVRLYHVGNTLVVASFDKMTFKTAPLSARAEDATTTQAAASAYAVAIETAYNAAQPFYTAADSTDYHDSIFKWGTNRLVIISRKFVRIWEV